MSSPDRAAAPAERVAPTVGRPAVWIPPTRTPLGAVAGDVWRFARTRPIGAVAALFVVTVLGVTLFANQVAPHDPVTQVRVMRRAPPGTTAPDGRPMLLGGDGFGRDVFSRLVHGARVDLLFGLVVAGTVCLLGIALGLGSGFRGGWLDQVIQRLMDTLMAFPDILLALMLISVLGNGAVQSLVAVGLPLVPYVTRIVRGNVLSAKQNPYVEAARSTGAGELRILTRHLLPNVLAPVLVLAPMYFGSAILTLASLSYLGFGVQPPNPSLGGMIRSAGSFYGYWGTMATLSLTLIALTLLGDALRDFADPRLRGRRA
jgi:ABC-type dipeptide/oligopeptide/nickel transport system permease subunit